MIFPKPDADYSWMEEDPLQNPDAILKWKVRSTTALGFKKQWQKDDHQLVREFSTAEMHNLARKDIEYLANLLIDACERGERLQRERDALTRRLTRHEDAEEE